MTPTKSKPAGSDPRPRFDSVLLSKRYALQFDAAKINPLLVTLLTHEKQSDKRAKVTKTLGEWSDLLYAEKGEIESDILSFSAGGVEYRPDLGEDSIGGHLLTLFAQVLAKGGTITCGWFYITEEDSTESPHAMTWFFLANAFQITVPMVAIGWDDKDGQRVWDYFEDPSKDDSVYTGAAIQDLAYSKLMYDKFYTETDFGKLEAMKMRLQELDTPEASLGITDIYSVVANTAKELRSIKRWVAAGFILIILLHFLR
jgi:hypothetical protein